MNPEVESRAGERRIGAAFRGSLIVIGVLAAVAVLIWWLMRPADTGGTIEEAEIAAPVAEPSTPVRLGPPALPFTDITAEAGIDFVHVNGAYGDKLMPETMGSGSPFSTMTTTATRTFTWSIRATGRSKAEGRTTSPGCIATTAAAASSTSPRRSVLKRISTAWASRWATTTTTAGRISICPLSARTCCCATSRAVRRRHRRGRGGRQPRGLEYGVRPFSMSTTTATSICSSATMSPGRREIDLEIGFQTRRTGPLPTADPSTITTAR